MFCNKCGSELNENDLFCSKCGANVEYNQSGTKEKKPTYENEILVDAIRKFKDGNKDSFATIYAETFKYVYRRAKYLLKNEDEAQDLTQDVYLTLYQRLDNLKDDNSVFGWLKTVVFRQGLKYIEKNKNILLTEADSEYIFEDVADEYVRFEEDYGHSEDAATVKRCLDLLSEEQRLVVLAYYYDNMSVKEIADVFDISEGTVKSRLYLARKRLMVILDEEEEKQGYKFFAAGIPALTMALDDIMNSDVEIAKDEIAAHYQETCSEIGIESEECIGLFGKLTSLGAKKIALAVAGVMVVGGIIGSAVIMSDDKNIETPEQETTKVVEEISEKGTMKDPAEDKELVDKLYGDYLAAYREYEESEFEEYPYEFEMISDYYAFLVEYDEYYDLELYYALVDLAGDGVPELFIGDKTTIYDTATPVSDENKDLTYVSDPNGAFLGERAFCDICENNIIRENGTGGASYNFVTYSKIAKNTCKPESGYGAEMDGEKCYSLKYDTESQEYIKDKEISVEQFWEICDNYSLSKDVTWHKLSEYKNADDIFMETIQPHLELLQSCDWCMYGAELSETEQYIALYESEELANECDVNGITMLVPLEERNDYPELYDDGILTYTPVNNFDSVEKISNNLNDYISSEVIADGGYSAVSEWFRVYDNQLYYVTGGIGNESAYDLDSAYYVEEIDGKRYVCINYTSLMEDFERVDTIEFSNIDGKWLITDIESDDDQY